MDDDFEQLLTLLGFTDNKRKLMAEESFTDFENFLTTIHEELDSMLSGFMKRPNNPITIPIKCRNLLHYLRNLSGDFDCHGMETATTWPGEEINTEEDVFSAMKLSQDRSKSCKSLKENTESIDGNVNFDNTDYANWRKDLMNQLASTLGANDVPLTYVVRPDEKTDESDFEKIHSLLSLSCKLQWKMKHSKLTLVLSIS